MVREKCGVYAAKCLDGDEVFSKLYWGIVAQNHRGHESYGFLTFSEGFRRYVDLGLVPRIEREEFWRWKILLPGSFGIAHVRYGTSGKRDLYSHLKDAQPIVSSKGRERIGIAYNGNLVNVGWLKEEIIGKGIKLRTTSDTELLCRYLLEKCDNDLVEGIHACMDNVEGAYSVVGLDSSGNMFAFRDPLGMRPLLYGGNGSLIAVSSESVGLNINEVRVFGEVEPGEALIFRGDSLERVKVVKKGRRAFCGFEFSYFMRPDSMINGRFVYRVREELGRRLGKRYQEFVKKADMIISIPETAEDAAYGLHEETGVRWERMLRRHRFVTQRAFIMDPNERVSTIDRKINVLSGDLQGKNVIVVEDSIVRGDTTKTVIRKLREGGADKIYVFVTFPRITHPCFYGIDMATFSELIGFFYDEVGIAKAIGADAVCYQTLQDFVEATGMRREDLCMACTTGYYPTELAQKIADRAKLKLGVMDRNRIYERAEV
ncbi:MAG: amidophosphoribosyltransferase [Candidatus Methanomethylicaceae archaeon]